MAQQRLQISPTRNFGKCEQPCYETCCILSPVDVKKSFLLAEAVSYMQAGGGHLLFHDIPVSLHSCCAKISGAKEMVFGSALDIYDQVVLELYHF